MSAPNHAEAHLLLVFMRYFRLDNMYMSKALRDLREHLTLDLTNLSSKRYAAVEAYVNYLGYTLDEWMADDVAMATSPSRA